MQTYLKQFLANRYRKTAYLWLEKWLRIFAAIFALASVLVFEENMPRFYALISATLSCYCLHLVMKLSRLGLKEG